MNLFLLYPHSRCIRCVSLVAGTGQWHCEAYGHREYDGLFCDKVEWLSNSLEEYWRVNMVNDTELLAVSGAVKDYGPIDTEDTAMVWSVHGYSGVLFKDINRTLLGLFIEFISKDDCTVHVQASDGKIYIERKDYE